MQPKSTPNSNFAQYVIEHNRYQLNKLAFRDGTQDLSYGDLIARIPKIAQGLLCSGLVPGNHVIISMEDCVDWPCVFLACLYAGIVPTPLSNALNLNLFYQLATFINCKTIIASNNFATQLNNSVPVISRSCIQNFYSEFDGNIAGHVPEENFVAYMNVSSGSTGIPKVAMHRHNTLFAMLELSPKDSYSMTKDSVMLSIAKMSWNFGLQNSVTYTAGLGATAILIPEAPTISVIFKYINQFKPSIVVTSPSIIRKFLTTAAEKFSLPSSIKHFHSSGEDLPRPIYDRFLARFNIRINCCIGMMETAANYAANPDWEHDPCTVGKPLPGCKIKIVNGEIHVQSPALAIGYYGDLEKSQATFVDGWIKTGDKGRWNEHNNLVFEGRIDDVFKVNDLIVNPVEIESVLLENQTIDQVLIYKGTNLKGLNESRALVVANTGFDLCTFNKWIADRLFPHQIPKKINLVEKLPETVTNKKNRKSVNFLC